MDKLIIEYDLPYEGWNKACDDEFTNMEDAVAKVNEFMLTDDYKKWQYPIRIIRVLLEVW
jgi:hypothetical protein